MYTKGCTKPSSQVKYLKLLYMTFLFFLICCGIINLYLSCGSFFFMLISLPGQEGLNLSQATFHGMSPL